MELRSIEGSGGRPRRPRRWVAAAVAGLVVLGSSATVLEAQVDPEGPGETPAGSGLSQSPADAAFAPDAQTPSDAQIPSDPRIPSDAPGPRITLAEAIVRSLRTDPAAVAAGTDVAFARAEFLEARGAWLPTLALGGAYNNSSGERIDNATGRLVSESYTAQATAGVLLFAGGRRIAEQSSASASVRAAVAELRAQRFATILTTTGIFYETAAAVDLEALARQRLERALQQLDFARTRLEIGTATTSDVLRAELEVGNAELAVLETGTALRTASLALARQIGVTGAVRPVEAALPEEAPPLPPTEALVDHALGSSPAVEASRAALRSRKADRRAAYSGYLPSVQLTGGYDWLAFDFPPDRRSWSVRLGTSLPLLNGLVREANLGRTAAAQRLAEARARDAAIGARVAVEAAVGEIATAERRVEISERAVGLAREDLRVLEERYQIGAATILDLQASQLSLVEAEAAAVRARQALGMAVAQLEAVLGDTIQGGSGE